MHVRLSAASVAFHLTCMSAVLRPWSDAKHIVSSFKRENPRGRVSALAALMKIDLYVRL